MPGDAHPSGEVRQVPEPCRGPRLDQRPGMGFLKSLHLAEADAQLAVLERGVPLRVAHVDGPDGDAVPLRVLDDGVRGVEAHRLAVEQRRGERRRVVALHVGARVGDERERRRVRLGEAVVAEPLELLEALLGVLAAVAASHAPLDEALAPGHEQHLGPLVAQRPAERVRLALVEPRRGHGEAHRLLLEQRDAERLFQNVPHLVRGVRHLLQPLAPAEEGVDHVPEDGPGADEGDLDGEVVEALRLQPGEQVHLRPALHLEDADRVRLTEHPVHRRVLAGDGGQVEPGATVLLDQRERLREHRQHAQAEEVDLEDAERVQVVLLPLDDGAVLHRGVLHRHHLGQLAVGDDEAAHVDGEVPREALQHLGEGERPLHARVLGAQTRLGHVHVGQGARPRQLGVLGQPVHLVQRQPERLAHLADGEPSPVADDLAHHPGALAAVLPVDVLQHLLAALVLEVHVDVRGLGALEAEEPLEEQPHPHRVDGGDAQRVADRRVGRAPPPLAEDAVADGEVDDVVEREEVAGHLELLDERELVPDLSMHRLGDPARIAEAEPLLDQVGEPALRGVARREVFLGELVAERVEREVAAVGDLQRAAHHLGRIGPQPEHLAGPLQRPLGVGEQLPAGAGHLGLVADRGERVLKCLALAGVGVHVVVGAERQLERAGQRPRPLPPRVVPGGQRAAGPDVEAAREGLGQRRHPLGLVREGQERDQSRAALGQRPPADARLSLGMGQPAPGQHLAEVAVAVRVLHVDDDRRCVGERDPGPVDELQPHLPGGEVGLHRAVQPVAVGQREPGQPQGHRLEDELLGVRGPLEEGVVGAADQLGVHAREGTARPFR